MNYTSRRPAEVAKLVDAPDSKSGGGNPVRVRVSLSAPNTWYYQSIGAPVRITRYWQYNQATSSPSNGFLLIYRCKPFTTANPNGTYLSGFLSNAGWVRRVVCAVTHQLCRQAHR